MDQAERLRQGCHALGLSLDETAMSRLLEYAKLLGKWNRVYNLTAIRDEQQVVSHHLLDSLSVLPHLKGIVHLADVGTGGGLPGIPLAIAVPQLHVTLIETNHKKSAFLTQACIELGLVNTRVINRRVEEVRAEPPFDAAISRAFSDVADFVKLAGHLVGPGGVLLAMKGLFPDEELTQLPQPWMLVESIALDVPGLDAARHLLRLTRN